MKLEEWTAQIISELKAAGYNVREYQGFPLVTMPSTHAETVAFLDFHPTLAADRSIYAEGCLFLPAGANLEISRLKREEKSA